jgi:hypothetical protein
MVSPRRRPQVVVYLLGLLGALIPAVRTILCPGATLVSNCSDEFRYILAPLTYVNSALVEPQVAVPVLVTFQPTVKLSLGTKVIPLPGDCQFSWQSNSGGTVGVGVSEGNVKVGAGERVCSGTVTGERAGLDVGFGVRDGSAVDDSVGDGVVDEVRVGALVAVAIGADSAAQAMRRGVRPRPTTAILTGALCLFLSANTVLVGGSHFGSETLQVSVSHGTAARSAST